MFTCCRTISRRISNTNKKARLPVYKTARIRTTICIPWSSGIELWGFSNSLNGLHILLWGALENHGNRMLNMGIAMIGTMSRAHLSTSFKHHPYLPSGVLLLWLNLSFFCSQAPCSTYLFDYHVHPMLTNSRGNREIIPCNSFPCHVSFRPKPSRSLRAGALEMTGTLAASMLSTRCIAWMCWGVRLTLIATKVQNTLVVSTQRQKCIPTPLSPCMPAGSEHNVLRQHRYI